MADFRLFKTRLAKAGVTVDLAIIKEAILDVRFREYSTWSDETLTQYPDEAMKFCNAVCAEVQANIPDDILLALLTTLRKAGKPWGLPHGKANTLTKDLAAAGCDNPKLFRQAVLDLFRWHFSEFTTETLLHCPREAKRLCAMMRKKSALPVPDHVVLRALTKARKNSEIGPTHSRQRARTRRG